MIRDVHSRDFVNTQLDEVRKLLRAGRLDEQAQKAVAGFENVPGQAPGASAAQTVLASLPTADAGPPSSGGEPDPTPFLSRSPIVSMLQTSMEENIRAERPDEVAQTAHGFHPGVLLHEVWGTIEQLLHPDRFGPLDPEWISRVFAAVADRLGRGNHRFNREPATHTIEDDHARIVLVGDWGSGIPRAKELTALMAEEVAVARNAGQEVHVIHLGDVYYSGETSEYDARLIAPWPVTQADADAGVTSWSLNGNHDMYSGGHAYFGHLLAHPLFAAQRAGDKATSWFHLTTPSWDIVALDTSWDPNPLAMGHYAVLEDPQGGYAADVARQARAAGRKLMLLSHHQYLPAYEPHDIGPILPRKLAPLIAGDGVDAWFWGHEHRCLGFDPAPGVRFARCIGHGGVPVVAHDANAPYPRGVTWEERDFLAKDGFHWGRFGFAVLDFAGGEVQVRYMNELGNQVRAAETIA